VGVDCGVRVRRFHLRSPLDAARDARKASADRCSVVQSLLNLVVLAGASSVAVGGSLLRSVYKIL
jgi:hypothetical protein